MHPVMHTNVKLHVAVHMQNARMPMKIQRHSARSGATECRAVHLSALSIWSGIFSTACARDTLQEASQRSLVGSEEEEDGLPEAIQYSLVMMYQ